MDIEGLLDWPETNRVGCGVEKSVVDKVNAVCWDSGIVFRRVETPSAT
jgi:hypothetical protein